MDEGKDGVTEFGYARERNNVCVCVCEIQIESLSFVSPTVYIALGWNLQPWTLFYSVSHHHSPPRFRLHNFRADKEINEIPTDDEEDLNVS